MPEQARRVLKIKHSNKCGRLTVTYERQRTDDHELWDEASITSYDLPSVEFWETVRTLGPAILTLLELPQGEALAGLAMCPHCRSTHYGTGMALTGVSYTWSHDIMGAVVTMQKNLLGADAPLILNTPHLPAAPYSDEGGGKLLPPELVEGLGLLAERALDYVDGRRAQLDLFPAAVLEKVQAVAQAAADRAALHHVQGLGVDRSHEQEDDAVLEPAGA